jgi:gag-polyprotein putative aspartyl protease
MRTLLLAATALIGVSAAHANPPTPAPVGRYFTLSCTMNATATEKWTLGLDIKDGHAEFSADGNPDSARWGYFTQAETTMTGLVGDPKAPMNLAMIETNDGGRLTWVQGGKSGVMDCRNPSFSDVRPTVWHDPVTAPAAKPTVFDPQVKPTASPVAAPLGSASLTYDNRGMNVAVSLGTMPVTMVIDTGAIGMTVTETVANWLVSNGQATNGPNEKHALADGVEKDFKTIDIGTLNVAGHEIHNVRAGVSPDSASMLLGLPILAQLAPKGVAFDFANAKVTFN